MEVGIDIIIMMQFYDLQLITVRGILKKEAADVTKNES